MRLPRDLSGDALARLLSVLGYVLTRQTGSHMRLTTEQRGTHHVTIPAHRGLRVGTLRSILGEIAEHHGMTVEVLASELFGE